MIVIPFRQRVRIARQHCALVALLTFACGSPDSPLSVTQPVASDPGPDGNPADSTYDPAKGAACSAGQTRSCNSESGCAGTETCSGGAWSGSCDCEPVGLTERCTSDADCGIATLICDETSGRCVNCTAERGCSAATSECAVTACGSQGLCVTPFAGNWTGRLGASGEWGLSFVVTPQGTIDDFVISERTSGVCGDTGVVEAVGIQTRLQDDGTFEITYTSCTGEGPCFGGTATGTLSATGASGTFDTESVSNLDEGCIGVISGPSTPWVGARDCSQRPLAGGSATRFCNAAGESIVDSEPVLPADGSDPSCSPCDAGLVACSEECIDPQADIRHCGASLGCGEGFGEAGRACGQGEVCAGGACQACTLALAYTETISVAGSAEWFDLGDIDGDQRADLAFVEFDAAGEALGTRSMLGNGSGGGGAAAMLAAPPLRSLGLVDLDSDGDLDAIGVDQDNQDTVLTFSNDGSGVFSPGATFLAGGDQEFAREVIALDLDGDAALDLAVLTEEAIGFLDGGTIRVNLFVGPDFSTSTSLAVGSYDGLFGGTGPLVAADLTGDGANDLAVLWDDSESFLIHAYVNDGAGTLTSLGSSSIGSPGGLLSAAVQGDLDGDGATDLLVGTGSAAVALFGNGSGAFQATPLPELASAYLALGNLTGDATQIVTSGVLAVSELSSRTAAQNVWTGTRNAERVRLGDIDGDGDLDVVAGSAEGFDLYVNSPCP